MQELLYLVHRIPYPPNKGDKIRSYHLLKHLGRRYRVHLGTFIDDGEDWNYVDKVKTLCGETCFAKLNPLAARMRSISGLISNSPLTLPYYQDASLQAWVNALLKARPVKNILVFSSAMAQYVSQARSAHRVIDFVDVDSDKWKQYAAANPWPLSWLYRREAKLLLCYEKQIAKDFDSATFVSEAEAGLFKRLAPEVATKITYFNNGVDTDYFSPQNAYPNPYPVGVRPLVFTGAMDYWANVDAVDWFARHVFPAISTQLPRARFYIVGAHPSSRVQELASLPGVIVTGSVADVRPYLAHAALAVAPLRIARGIQNKVLEAMAMEKPVVASPQAIEGINAIPGKELFVAKDERDFARQVAALLQAKSNAAIGHAARVCVTENYCWANNLGKVDELLAQSRTIDPVIDGSPNPQDRAKHAEEEAA